MNGSNAQQWSGAEHFTAMDAAADHDFGNLIDFEAANFDHLDLDWPNSDNQQLADLADSLDVHQLQGHFTPQIPQDARNNTNGFFDYSMGQYSQANTPAFPQAQEQLYQPHQGVPPTPNSVEMHGDPHRYLQQLDPQQTLFDQRYHMRKDDAVCLDRAWLRRIETDPV